MSVFAGGFELDSACSVSGQDEFEALDVLGQLVDRSLVSATGPSTGATRYSMLETMRQFGRERLIESAAVDQVRDRHLDWAVELTQSISADVELCLPAATERADSEMANIRVALDWATHHTDAASKGVEIVSALGRYWYLRGLAAEGADWIDRLRDLDPSMNPALETRALSVLGVNLMKSGHIERALEVLNSGLELARRVDDDAILASVLASLVNAAIGVRESSQLFEWTREGLDLAVGLGDELLTYRHSIGTAVLHIFFSELDEALDVCARFVSEFGNTRSPHQAGHVREIGGGWIALRAGDPATARPHLLAALRSYRDAANPNCSCHALETLAWLIAQEGDADTAHALLSTVVAIRQRGSHERTDAECFPYDHVTPLLGAEPTTDEKPALIFEDLPAGLDYGIALLENAET